MEVVASAILIMVMPELVNCKHHQVIHQALAPMEVCPHRPLPRARIPIRHPMHGMESRHPSVLPVPLWIIHHS